MMDNHSERGVYFELTESADQMELAMKTIDRKQTENETYLKNIKSNLNDLKFTLTYFLKKLQDSEDKSTSAGCCTLPPQHFRLHPQDVMRQNNLHILLLEEIQKDTTKLNENEIAVKAAQSSNFKHLEKLRNALQEIEKRAKETELKTAQLERRSLYRNDSAVQIREAGSQTRKICAKNANCRRIDKKINANKDRLESEDAEGERRVLDTEKCTQKKKSNVEANVTDNEERPEPPSEMEDFLSDAERTVLEMRKKLNDFEIDSRKMLNNLESDISSVWMICKEQKRSQEEQEESTKNRKEMSVSNCKEQRTSTTRNSLHLGGMKAYLDTRSENAESAIRRSTGPLTPDQLTTFLDDVKHKQNVMKFVFQFTQDAEGLLQQLKHLETNLEDGYKNVVKSRFSTLKDLDQRLLNRLPNLIKNVEICLQEMNYENGN